MSEQRGPGAADDETVAEPFDQTNGVVGGLTGDSDGTAGSDTASAADRQGDDGDDIRDTDDVGGQGALDAGLIVGRQAGGASGAV